jgi:hypothetical protein
VPTLVIVIRGDGPAACSTLSPTSVRMPGPLWLEQSYHACNITDPAGFHTIGSLFREQSHRPRIASQFGPD